MAGEASLGDLSFRLAPSQVNIEYTVHTNVTNTVGGRVVQVFGASVGDLTIHGLFGQDRVAEKTSAVLAEEFAQSIGRMVQQQSKLPSAEQLRGEDPTTMHPTFRFQYDDDTPQRRAQGLPVHKWDFQVYIKSLRDAFDAQHTISHTTGKFSHGYTLTLFVVEDNTGQLIKAAEDGFIEKMSNAIGWKRTPYNGFMDKEELKNYVGGAGGDIHKMVLDAYNKASSGEIGIAGTDPVKVPPGNQGGGTQPPPPPPADAGAPPPPPPPADAGGGGGIAGQRPPAGSSGATGRGGQSGAGGGAANTGTRPPPPPPKPPLVRPGYWLKHMIYTIFG